MTTADLPLHNSLPADGPSGRMLKIYKASAGSGKTYRLAQTYIRLLLCDRDDEGNVIFDTDTSGPAPRRRLRLARSPRSAHRYILAITFTNKATEEMKNRIIHELAILAGREPDKTLVSNYEKDLTADFGCTPAQLREAAATALSQLLNDFSLFNVSTIDSFFQLILRTFAHEAELTGNYEVDLQPEHAISVAVGELLASINRDNAPADIMRLEHWLYDYIEDALVNGKSFDIFNRASAPHADLLGFFKMMSTETYEKTRNAFEHYFNNPESIVAFADKRRKLLITQQQGARSASQRALDAADAVSSAIPEVLSKNCRGFLVKWAVKGFVKELSATAVSIASGKSSPFTKDKQKEAAKAGISLTALEETVVEAARTIVKAHALCTESRQILDNLYALGLTDRITENIARYRRDTATLLLSDTNSLINEIIGRDETPFIYERTGRLIKHFLIDEFQDTSEMQMSNLDPLLRESLASGNENLIIGDEKQCIYRFRNSDPEILATLDTSRFSTTSEVVGNDASGNTNRRSSSVVVRFNNTFFKALSELDEETARIYANTVQCVADKEERGYVAFYNVRGEGRSLIDREAAFAICAREIRRQMTSGGYRGGDIAVLFRKNCEGAAFIDYLNDMKAVAETPEEIEFYRRLKVVSDESLMITSSAAVRKIINVLRLMCTPGQSEPLDEASAARLVSRREIASLVYRFEQTYNGDTDAGEALAGAIAEINRRREAHPDICAEAADILSAKGSTTLIAVVDHIISTRLTPGEMKGQSPFVTALRDLVIDFMARGNNDIRSFVEWWDTTGVRASISSGADPDAIRIMTIHKSKGLEFRCVHLPMLGTQAGRESQKWFRTDKLREPDAPPLLPLVPGDWMKESDAFKDEYNQLRHQDRIDETNVLYVAFTRAKDELTVCFPYIPPAKSKSSNLISETIRALETGATPSNDPSLTLRPAINAAAADENTPVLVAGSPTVRTRDKKKETSALDAVAGRPVDCLATAGAEYSGSLWADTRLDSGDEEDDEPLPAPTPSDADVAVATLRSLPRLDRLGRSLRRLTERGVIDRARADSLSRDITRAIRGDSRLTQWFDNSDEAIVNRIFDRGFNGWTARVDRIVRHSDNTTDVVQIARADAPESVIEAARSRGRMVSKVWPGDKVTTWLVTVSDTPGLSLGVVRL